MVSKANFTKLFIFIFVGQLRIYTGQPQRVLNHPKLFEFIEKIKESNFNAIHLNYGLSEVHLKTYRKSHQLNLKIFIHLGGPYKIDNQGLAINERGKQINLPCPLNKKIWNEYIYNKILTFYEKFKNEEFLSSVIGFHFDIETYVDPDICYCDKCFYDFIAKNKYLQDDIPKERRRDFLCEKRLLENYKNFLMDNLVLIFKDIETEIHSFKNDILISYYPFVYKKFVFLPKIILSFFSPSFFPPPLWWYVYRKSDWISLAFLKGFGNKKLPVIAWDDYYYWSGYISGYDKKIKEEIKKFLGYDMLWFPSIDYVSECKGRAEYTPKRAAEEYVKLLKANEYGAICYGESKKDKDLWETHLPYFEEFKKHIKP